jgi:hypothetical protein
MSDPNTLRILEIDGGGARDYLSLLFLNDFVNLWGIDPTTISQQFDVICGTSAGGITALYLANGSAPDELITLFTTQVPYVFSLTSLTPSLRPNLAAKLALIVADTPFYQSSGPTEAAYGAGLLTATLQSKFGTSTLQDLQTNVIIPSYNYTDSTYVLFSNVSNSQFIGQNELISNVALCTSAAPIYLPGVTLGDGNTYIDGGVYQNNASQFGRTLGQILKPNANRTCILSIGTGIGEMGFDPGNPDIIDERVDHIVRNMNKEQMLAFDSIQTIFALFDISCAGAQESISVGLGLEANYTLNQTYYYRFQPQLSTDINTELDNTDTEIFEYYQATETSWFEADIDNITNFLGHLTA